MGVIWRALVSGSLLWHTAFLMYPSRACFYHTISGVSEHDRLPCMEAGSSLASSIVFFSWKGVCWALLLCSLRWANTLPLARGGHYNGFIIVTSRHSSCTLNSPILHVLGWVVCQYNFLTHFVPSVDFETKKTMMDPVL